MKLNIVSIGNDFQNEIKILNKYLKEKGMNSEAAEIESEKCGLWFIRVLRVIVII